jgi:predicted NBD/HSP70 family sugar kinase
VTKEPVRIGRPPLLRQTNAQILLRLLREAGPCSKADLVRASGLSAPSVTNVVAHLALAGLVAPIGEGDSTGGRPPDILRFRAERGCVAGVEIGPDSLGFLLADLDGREIGKARVSLERSSSTPPLVCRRIGEEVRDLLRKLSQPEDQLLELVVGVPAIVNVQEGIVMALSALKDWSNVPLGAMLAREFKCNVTIENDTNLAAQGEHYRGAAQGEKNFVFITIGEGVGAGIFVNGSIYRGSQWTAGEIGYLRVPNISREHPTIHNYGKLEKLLGAPGILKSWQASRRGSHKNPKVTCAADVFDLAAAGNAEAKRLLKQRATLLADIVLDLALILNPSVILLGGEVGNHPRLLQEVEALLKGSEFAIVRVGLGALGSSAVLWGSICSALEPAVLGLLQPSDSTSSSAHTRTMLPAQLGILV